MTFGDYPIQTRSLLHGRLALRRTLPRSSAICACAEPCATPCARIDYYAPRPTDSMRPLVSTTSSAESKICPRCTALRRPPIRSIRAHLDVEPPLSQHNVPEGRLRRTHDKSEAHHTVELLWSNLFSSMGRRVGLGHLQHLLSILTTFSSSPHARVRVEQIMSARVRAAAVDVVVEDRALCTMYEDA